MQTIENPESGQAVAKHVPRSGAGASRFHVDHWRERVYHKTFTRDEATHEVPEWSVRLQHLGRREAFALGTANVAVASAKAKEIATYLDANGWDATIAKHKPGPLARAEVCTIGEFLADVKARSHLRPLTVLRYAIKFRKLVADVARVESGMKPKQKRRKHYYAGEGRKMWLAKVHGQRLDVLTPDSINAWRNKYVARAGDDPLKRKSAERSAASIMRCSRALFNPDITRVLKVKLPANPFAGVKLKDPGPQRYHSDVSAEWLLSCAGNELREKHPQQYLALFLCLWAGLRRKEADLLMWEQINFDEGKLHVRRTAYFEPKTEESQRMVDLTADAMDVLRSFKLGCTSEFVLAGGEPNPSASYIYYRANRTWKALNTWLRGKGIRERKAVHMLRKESGSLIASTYGIEAARQHLGHRDIRTTSAHYVEKRKRVEVQIPIAAKPGVAS